MSALPDMPMQEAIEMLESIADSHWLELNLALMNFANEIFAQGYEQGIRDEALYQDMKEA